MKLVRDTVGTVTFVALLAAAFTPLYLGIAIAVASPWAQWRTMHPALLALGTLLLSPAWFALSDIPSTLIQTVAKGTGSKTIALVGEFFCELLAALVLAGLCALFIQPFSACLAVCIIARLTYAAAEGWIMSTAHEAK